MPHKILIVDDSPTELHVLAKIVKQGGHEALTASDGEAGIAAAQAQLLIEHGDVEPGRGGGAGERLVRLGDPGSA